MPPSDHTARPGPGDAARRAADPDATLTVPTVDLPPSAAVFEPGSRFGRYRIDGIFAGTYPKVMAGGNGWDRQLRAALSIRSGENVANWAVRRDWAALAGGASVTRTNDDTGAPFGCGAAAMFDQSQGSGWSAFRRVRGGAVQPVFVVVELPRAVDVSEIAIDPSATCGDGGSASTGDYRVECRLPGKGTHTVELRVDRARPGFGEQRP